MVLATVSKITEWRVNNRNLEYTRVRLLNPQARFSPPPRSSIWKGNMRVRKLRNDKNYQSIALRLKGLEETPLPLLRHTSKIIIKSMYEILAFYIDYLVGNYARKLLLFQSQKGSKIFTPFFQIDIPYDTWAYADLRERPNKILFGSTDFSDRFWIFFSSFRQKKIDFGY